MKRLIRRMNGRIIGRLDEEEPDFNRPELFADLPLRDRCTHASSAGDDGPSWALLGGVRPGDFALRALSVDGLILTTVQR